MKESNLRKTKYDPYKNFKFRIKINGNYVAGFSKISTPKRNTERIASRDRVDSINTTSPGRVQYDSIILERGMTHDQDFQNWAKTAFTDPNLDSETSLNDHRRDLIIEVFDENGKEVFSYRVDKCWISEFQTLPIQDANSNSVAIQQITLECEGWERI